MKEGKMRSNVKQKLSNKRPIKNPPAPKSVIGKKILELIDRTEKLIEHLENECYEHDDPEFLSYHNKKLHDYINHLNEVLEPVADKLRKFRR